MGVRGLLTYLHYHCPDASYRVNVGDLISEESSRTGCCPTIVVDAPSCFSMWCKGLDWTVGLQVQELIGRLRSFVEAFNDMGAELVFFVGGLTPLKKRTTWLSRRITSMHSMMDVYDILYADDKSYKDIPAKLNSVPPNIGNFISFVLKYVLDCTVFVSVRDCDAAVINYVKENDCFAIFAYDSDFIVSRVQCKVLDANTYDCVEKTALLYDRKKLCRYLSIRRNQLPFLAILAGNDFVDFKSLRPFHYKICNWSSNKKHIPYKVLMESIADYINDLPRRFSFKLMEKICEDVFGDNNEVHKMIRAFFSYTPRPCFELDLDDNWSRILKIAKVRLQNVLLPPSAWGVLSKRVYESSVCLEDMRKVNDANDDVKDLPSATITRDLRRRFYGVLLFEKRDSETVVREWCAENKESYRWTVKVDPEFPKVHHPGLRALWATSRANTHYQNKWKLFLGAVSPDIDNVDDWMTLPHDLVVSTATCYYLHIEKLFLTSDELRVILMTLAMYSHYYGSSSNDIKKTENLRAIRISVTFSRTYSLVFSLMASCGFPVPLSEDTAHIRFEPILFLALYKKVKQGSSLEELCEDNINVLEKFQQMENVIYG